MKIIRNILLTGLGVSLVNPLLSTRVEAKDFDLGPGQFVLSLDAPIPDARNPREYPRNYRTTRGPFLHRGDPSKTGLKELPISGSAEFNKTQFTNMLTKLRPILKDGQKILVMDLRQESHALISDLAVSWFGKNNTLNAGKNLAQVESDERARIQTLKNSKTVVLKEWIRKISKKTGKEKSKVRDATVSIQDVMSEREFVESLGVEYMRVPIADHQRPEDDDVDSIVKKFLELKSKNYWVHAHCAAGAGRTTMVMSLWDMLSNCQNVSEKDIITRQNLIGGSNLWADGSVGTRKEWAKTRKDFLHTFYLYCKAQGPDFKETWSQWIRSHRAESTTSHELK